jgi:two-component system phosphate regulon response regulator OmpR
MNGGTHIVVVEEEVAQRQLLVQYLMRQGLKATGLADAPSLRREMQREQPAIVLLDIGLPGEDGFSVIRHLRETYPAVGLIVISASADMIDRVAGLEAGADDFITKPFEPRELLARVKSVLRRVALASYSDTAGPRVSIGRRILDLERRLLMESSGLEERLAPGEFNLLKLFVENPNRPLSRDWLLEVTSHREADAFDRAIDLRIARLRRKIEVNPAHPEAIRTVRGVGYMFVPKGA